MVDTSAVYVHTPQDDGGTAVTVLPAPWGTGRNPMVYVAEVDGEGRVIGPDGLPLAHEAVARSVASDPHRQDRPVVLLVPGAASQGQDLAHTIATLLNAPVWAPTHQGGLTTTATATATATGTPMTRITVHQTAGGAGVPLGDLVRVDPPSPAPRRSTLLYGDDHPFPTLFPGRMLTRRQVMRALVRLAGDDTGTPLILFDPTGPRPRLYHHFLGHRQRLHAVQADGRLHYTAVEDIPADQVLPPGTRVIVAHGSPGAITLTIEGNTVQITPDVFGQLLGGLREIQELSPDTLVVLEICFAATGATAPYAHHPDSAVPTARVFDPLSDQARSPAQHFADTSGLATYAHDGISAMTDQGPADTPTGRRMHLPLPPQPLRMNLAREINSLTGLSTGEQDIARYIRALRLRIHPHADTLPDFMPMLRGLAVLDALHRNDPTASTLSPYLSLELLDHTTRQHSNNPTPHPDHYQQLLVLLSDPPSPLTLSDLAPSLAPPPTDPAQYRLLLDYLWPPQGVPGLPEDPGTITHQAVWAMTNAYWQLTAHWNTDHTTAPAIPWHDILHTDTDTDTDTAWTPEHFTELARVVTCAYILGLDTTDPHILGALHISLQPGYWNTETPAGDPLDTTQSFRPILRWNWTGTPTGIDLTGAHHTTSPTGPLQPYQASWPTPHNPTPPGAVSPSHQYLTIHAERDTTTGRIRITLPHRTLHATDHEAAHLIATLSNQLRHHPQHTPLILLIHHPGPLPQLLTHLTGHTTIHYNGPLTLTPPPPRPAPRRARPPAGA
ncbi:hypothetical protein ACIP84_38660, partial [Streptomyces sp. NPDC088707]